MSDITWVKKSEAAWLLGKSERTITRWVSDGKMLKQQTTTGVLVGLSDEKAAISPTKADNSELIHLRAEAAQLKAELERLTIVRDRLNVRVEELTWDKEHWRQQAEAGLVNQRLLLEARKRRWWPWDRGCD